MAMDAHEIERMIKASLPDAAIEIKDLAGDGDHYAATVISESFRGKSRVQQHQIVYKSLQGQMGGVLHALALQTGVPALAIGKTGGTSLALPGEPALAIADLRKIHEDWLPSYMAGKAA